jgi:quercetin dioxygenase-like cupin family protein
MATSGVKLETPISSGFAAPNRFRLKVRKVVMAAGDYPEHTHQGTGWCIVHKGAVEITQRSKTNRYQKGDFSSEVVTPPM